MDQKVNLIIDLFMIMDDDNDDIVSPLYFAGTKLLNTLFASRIIETSNQTPDFTWSKTFLMHGQIPQIKIYP
jgi:hypothetical protein